MILLDFDGTIIDLWPRYYTVFQNLLNLDISQYEYKEIKQRYKIDSLVAKHFGKELPFDYFERKRVMLEDRNLLKKDVLLLELRWLNRFLEGDVYILTKRRNKENFLWQIQEMGIHGKSIVLDGYSKAQWIEQNLNGNEKTLVVGDSLEELRTSIIPNVTVWLVGYGMSTKIDFDAAKLPYTYIEEPMLLQRKLDMRMMY